MSKDHVWLASYPETAPAEIDTTQYASVAAMFEQACSSFADRPAFSSMGKLLTYAELDRLSLQFASALRNRLGLAKGDRVALMMPNLLQYPIALFGILRAGLTVVNTNPMYTPRELKHQLNDSGAKAIVVLDKFAPTLQEVRKDTGVEHVILTSVGDMLGFPKSLLVNFVLKHVRKDIPAFDLPGHRWFRDVLRDGGDGKLPKTDIGPEDIAFLQYTGGTTGVSKGAMLTHRNMVANMLQVSAFFGPTVKEGQEIIITALPLYHIFALTCNCLVFMNVGGMNVLIADPRDMAGFVKGLGKHRFSIITGVNTLFNGLLNTAGFADLDFSQLKLSMGGGMAVQRAVAERWQKVTGCALFEGYGMTES